MITYYTDMHDVDEDVKTIMFQGGAWPDVVESGVYRRQHDAPTAASSWVASRLIYLS